MVKTIGTRKLIDRLVIVLGLSIIIIVFMLGLHINMYLQLSKQIQKPFRPKYDRNEPIIQHNRADFRRNFEDSDSSTRDREMQSRQPIDETTETFQDLYDAIEKMEVELFGESSSSTSVKPQPSPTLGELLDMKITDKTTSLELFQMQITANEMYPENSTVIDRLLADMASLPIEAVEEKDGGTQFKLKITFRNGMKALFKPKRLDRNQPNAPNIAYYSEYERHNAEVAAFHVDRLLGFRRALPTVGRTVDAVTEIMRVSNSELKNTFFKSPKPDENVCLTGNCLQFCDKNHPICANGDKLEGSFMAFLPDDADSKRKTYLHPYMRTYKVDETAEWENNPNFCEKVKENYPMTKNRHLLDFVDTAILDFLIGNLDRHNYQIFRVFNNSFHMHYDHGRSFGRPFFDDFSILAPVTQCCVIRSSTLKTLLRYHDGPKPFSAALREALSNDPIAPVLWEPYLTAIDRRIELILKELRTCITKKPSKSVIIFS